MESGIPLNSLDPSSSIVNANGINPDEIDSVSWESMCALAQGFQHPQQQVVVLGPPPDNSEFFALLEDWNLGYLKEKFKSNIFI